MIRKTLALLFLISCIALIGKGWHWAKDGFNIQRVRTAFATDGATLAPNEVPNDITDALNQTFSYLGQGRQYYVFESKDGKYVLKLPRLDRYEVPFWLQACPFPIFDEVRKKVCDQRKHRLEFLLESSRIAFEEINEQTAVLMLHFYKTQCFNHFTVVTDRIGRKFQLDLDNTPFVLQEKKTLMMAAFEESLKREDREKTKLILDSFLKMIANRSKKGIFNKDHCFLRNCGVDEKMGFEVDIGSFYHKQSEDHFFKTPLQETVGYMGPWLGKIDAGLQKWFECKAQEYQKNSCDF